jgi:hypothetical protein
MEIWKDIEGYEGLYQVSNLGRVISLERKEKSGKLFRKRNQKILKLESDKRGYQRILLYKNNVTKKYLVHRLVCLSFLKNHENKKQINHINGVKYDNRLENLEWCNQSENQIHAYKKGLQKPIIGEDCVYSKINECIAIKIKYSYKDLYLKDIAKKYNIALSTICDIRKGRTWKHI